MTKTKVGILLRLKELAILLKYKAFKIRFKQPEIK
jgi:hypothetical protein